MPLAVAYATVTALVRLADSVSVTIALVVPVLPSVIDTSAMAMVGSATSSLTMVTTAWPSADRRIDGGAEVDGERLVRLDRRVSEDRNRDRRELVSGAKVTVPDTAV